MPMGVPLSSYERHTHTPHPYPHRDELPLEWWTTGLFSWEKELKVKVMSAN